VPDDVTSPPAADPEETARNEHSGRDRLSAKIPYGFIGIVAVATVLALPGVYLIRSREGPSGESI